jgi:hypothetical protein
MGDVWGPIRPATRPPGLSRLAKLAPMGSSGSSDLRGTAEARQADSPPSADIMVREAIPLAVPATHQQTTAIPTPRRRRRRRRWLRVLCLLVGGAEALLAAVMLLTIAGLSPLTHILPQATWNLQLRAASETQSQTLLWWLEVVGWVLVGLGGLMLLGRAAARHRPRLFPSFAWLAATLLLTISLSWSVCLAPAGYTATTSLRSLEEATGLRLPMGTRVLEGRVQRGPTLQVRAKLVVPSDSVGPLLEGLSPVWPAGSRVVTEPLANQLERLADEEGAWGFSDWRPSAVPEPVAVTIAVREAASSWRGTVLADGSEAGRATLYLDCREEAGPAQTQ